MSRREEEEASSNKILMTNKSDQREQHEHFTTILTRECSQNIDLRIFE